MCKPALFEELHRCNFKAGALGQKSRAREYSFQDMAFEKVEHL